MLSTNLILPRFVASGIKPSNKGHRVDKYIYGADTETFFGKPMSMQFYSEDCACDQIDFVSEATAMKRFLAWCGKRRRNVAHVVYVHMLSFDLIEFLWGVHAKLVEGSGEFEFKVGEWHIRGLYGTPTYCTIKNGHDITVTLVDSFSFFRKSLAAAAEVFCPDLPKLKRMTGLGERKFTAKDTGFVDYAMRDAVVAYHIGKSVEAMHEEYDLPQCISIADMAARIFRHRFLTYTIPQPSREIIDASVLSYHGGKNNITVEKGWYEGVTSLDISSAYPKAMHGLPAFSNAKLYKRFRATKVREVPEYGVYAVRGKVAECDWPVIFSHGFKPLHGDISDVYVQGFELNEALKSGEFKPISVRGWYYDDEKDHQAPALRNFCDHFYEQKQLEKNPGLRQQKKDVLNSVSGKFIQTRKRGTCAFTDIDADVTVSASELVAGGMFHPFIASAITAHTRAHIHRLEHQYKAIHTATDGIMTQARNARPMGKGLGSLTLEAQDATALILRNKCYIVYTKKGKKTIPSKVFKGRHISKYALHGFQGSVTDLERLVATGKRKYTVNRPNRLRESIDKGLTPNEFVKRDYTLKIGALPVNQRRK